MNVFVDIVDWVSIPTVSYKSKLPLIDVKFFAAASVSYISDGCHCLNITVQQ